MLERFRGKASPLALPGLQERRAEVMVRQNGAPAAVDVLGVT